MSKETEKVFRAIHKYMEGKEFDNEDEANAAIQEFINKYNNAEIKFEPTPEDEALDLLDEAYEAATAGEAARLAKEAIKKDKNCVDAKLFLLDCQYNDYEKEKKTLEKIIGDEENHLKDEFFNEDCIGDFYGILETRPYMRAKMRYALLLADMGKYTLAIREFEDMLKLSENDNMGARYSLIGLYSKTENLSAAEELLHKYGELHALGFTFPMAVLYYKIDDMRNAKKFLKKSYENNCYLVDFLDGTLDLESEETKRAQEMGGYMAGEVSELLVVIREGRFEIEDSAFWEWGEKEIKKIVHSIEKTKQKK